MRDCFCEVSGRRFELLGGGLRVQYGGKGEFKPAHLELTTGGQLTVKSLVRPLRLGGHSCVHALRSA